MKHFAAMTAKCICIHLREIWFVTSYKKEYNLICLHNRVSGLLKGQAVLRHQIGWERLKRGLTSVPTCSLCCCTCQSVFGSGRQKDGVNFFWLLRKLAQTKSYAVSATPLSLIFNNGGITAYHDPRHWAYVTGFTRIWPVSSWPFQPIRLPWL